MKKMILLAACFVLFLSCGDKADKEENDGVNDADTSMTDDGSETTDKKETDDKAEISDDEVSDKSEENDNNSGSDETPDEDIEEGPMKINSGTGIGGFVIGMTYQQIKDKYGDPDSPICFNRLGSAKYKDLAVEVVFASTEQYQISDDAKLIAVGAMTGGEFQGDVLPGMTRTEIEKLMKDAEKEDTGKYVYYTEGFSVQYEDDKAVTIGVYPPYELKYDVPTMEKCKTTIN